MMRAGVTRVDVPYRWPTRLVQPERPPLLVYLDLNHWVALSKAMAGHPAGAAHADTLAACLEAKAAGTAVFPISDSTFHEINNNVRHRQRVDLRKVIEALSGFKVVTSRTIVSTLEVEALLDDIVGPNPNPPNAIPYLDWGVARTFGMVGGFQIVDGTGRDITAATRAGWPDGPAAFDALLASTDLLLQRSVLDGPAPDEEEELREYGYNPRGGMGIAQQRVQQEIEQVARFRANEHFRRERIRDAVSCREIVIEIQRILWEALAARTVTLEDAFGEGPEAMRAAFDSMPSFDVAVSMKTAYHRDLNHRWTVNDITDVDALGLAVPYCDVVVTDKAAAATVNAEGLASRLGTVVLGRLSDVASHL